MRMPKKKIWIAAVSVILVAALVVGVVMVTGKSEPVAVFSWDMVGFMDYFSNGGESSGMVTTDKVQTIYLSETQTVTKIHVQQDQQVKKGDLLISYDTTLSDLALERKDLDVQQKEITLDNARTELDRLYAMKPMVVTPPPETKPDPEKIDHTKSPKDPKLLGTVYDKKGGGATVLTPLYFWLSGQQTIGKDLIEYLWQECAADPQQEHLYVVFQLTPEDKADTAFEREYGLKFTRVDPVQPPSTEPTQPTEPMPTAPQPTQPEGTEPVPTEPEMTEPETTEPEVTEPEVTEPEVTEVPTEPPMEPAFFAAPVPGDPTYQMSFFVPGKDEDSNPGPQIDWNSGYTEEELIALRKEKEAQIVQLEHDVKMGKAELNIMKKEASAGEVRAEFDGTISSVLEPENALASQEPVVKLNGGGGFYVEGSVGEMDLQTMQIGQKVMVTSWENGQMFEGEVVQVGQYPSDEQNNYYYNQPNQTYYPYRVFISEDANLMEGSYVGLTYQAQQSQEGVMCLQNAFIRTEGGESYVYVRNDKGLLEKRIIQTGVSQNGSYTPIYGGVTQEDLVAFPYGKHVKEGAKTYEGTEQDLYGY